MIQNVLTNSTSVSDLVFLTCAAGIFKQKRILSMSLPAGRPVPFQLCFAPHKELFCKVIYPFEDASGIEYIGNLYITVSHSDRKFGAVWIPIPVRWVPFRKSGRLKYSRLQFQFYSLFV